MTAHPITLGIVALALVACCKAPAPPSLPGSGSGSAVSAAGDAAVPSSPTAESRARAVLQKQIDAALSKDEAVLRATFAPGAIVLTPEARESEQLVPADLFDVHGSEDTTAATISKLTAGGTSDVVWFYAELTAHTRLGDDLEAQESTSIIRVVELVAASESWRAVASSFTSSRQPQPSASNDEIERATTAEGPLTTLVGQSSALVQRMTPTALLVGPQRDQQAQGPDAARRAIAEWKLEPMIPVQRARDVRSSSWAFIQVNADHPDGAYTQRLTVQVFAVPARDGGWDVVLAQYLAQ